MAEDKNRNRLVFGDRRNEEDEGDTVSLSSEESEGEPSDTDKALGDDDKSDDTPWSDMKDSDHEDYFDDDAAWEYVRARPSIKVEKERAARVKQEAAIEQQE